MPTLLINNKQQQRKSVLKLRRSMALQERKEYSQLICEAIMADEDYANSKSIMVFASMADEVALDYLIKESLNRGKLVCLPYITNVNTRSMIAVAIKTLSDLVVGKYGILTVDENKLVKVDKDLIDLVLVPGVAYDYKGHRLGMGGGYYDRFLCNMHRTKTIAPIFGCQLIENLIYEKHDISVDKICTERGVIKCDRNHC